MVITPRPFNRLIGEAMLGLVQLWRSLALPAVTAAVAAGAITAVVFSSSGGASFLELLVNDPDRFQTISDDVFRRMARPFYIAALTAVALQVLSATFIALVSHRAVVSHLRGGNISARQVAADALRLYPVGAAATLLVVVGIAALTVSGIALWLMPLLSVGTPSTASLAVAVLLLVAMIGPATWATVAMSMTTPAVAIERRGVLSSIRRSISLVRGRWWPTAGFLLVVGLLGGIAIQLIQLIAVPLAATGTAGAPLTVATAIGVVTQGLLMAAIGAMCTHWYVDLRSRRERLTISDLG